MRDKKGKRNYIFTEIDCNVKLSMELNLGQNSNFGLQNSSLQFAIQSLQLFEVIQSLQCSSALAIPTTLTIQAML